jgi:hypothetical protein
MVAENLSFFKISCKGNIVIDTILKSIIQAKKLGKPNIIVNSSLDLETLKQLFELGYTIQNVFEKGRGNVTKVSW